MEGVIAYIDGKSHNKPKLDFDPNIITDIVLRFKIKYLYHLECDYEFMHLSKTGELFPILEKYRQYVCLENKLTITNFKGLASIHIYLELFGILTINDEFIHAYQNIDDPHGLMTIHLIDHAMYWESYYPMLKLVIPEKHENNDA